LIQRLGQGLREADDRLANNDRLNGQADRSWIDTANQTAEGPGDTSYLAAKNPWLQQQLATPLELGDRPFVVGRRPAAWEGLPPRQPDLELNDPPPFRLSRNHFTIEKRDGGYRVRDLCSTLGTIVNGEPIGHYASTARANDAPLRAGENEVIAGGPDSPFVFSVFITSKSDNDAAGNRRFDPSRPGKNTDWQICIADRRQMTLRKSLDYGLPPGQPQFQNRINETDQLQRNRIVEADKLEGNRQSSWNDAGKNCGGYYSGLRLGAGASSGTTIAALPHATVAVRRLFIVLAASVLLSGCGLAVGQDVRAYNTCLSRHPEDTVVCEGPRQAYELDPSVVQLRSVASHPAAGYGF
jgi:hypothetical protein